MKHLFLVLFVLLVVAGCGNDKKKAQYINTTATLVGKSFDIGKDVYTSAFPDRKALNTRLNKFLAEVKSLEPIDGWSASDSIKNHLFDLYNLDIRNNRSLDSLESIGDSSVRTLSSLTNIVLNQKRKSINDMIKDELDKLKLK